MSATTATAVSDVLAESFADSVNIVDLTENDAHESPSKLSPRVSVTERVTAARVNDKRQLEMQQNTVPHHKDPWWEQRGGKGEEKIRASHKYDNVTSKLLSPTTAYKAGSRDKATPEPSTPESPCHGAKTKAIDPTAGLLRPTTATLKQSWAVAKDQQIKETEKEVVSPTPNLTDSKRTGPQVASRLHDLTTAFKAAQYKPKGNDEFDSLVRVSVFRTLSFLKELHLTSPVSI
jgi:hypothetical protein